jgi:hypothetical protein
MSIRNSSFALLVRAVDSLAKPTEIESDSPMIFHQCSVPNTQLKKAELRTRMPPAPAVFPSLRQFDSVKNFELLPLYVFIGYPLRRLAQARAQAVLESWPQSGLKCRF